MKYLESYERKFDLHYKVFPFSKFRELIEGQDLYFDMPISGLVLFVEFFVVVKGFRSIMKMHLLITYKIYNTVHMKRLIIVSL